MNLTVKFEGLKETEKWAEALAKGELAFGVAKGLTDLGGAARDEVVWDLPNKFQLRTAWWKPGNMYGFNVKKATKSDLRVEIFTRAPWMQLQEEGGVKKIPGKRLAMPTRGNTGIRRTQRDLIPKNLKPSALGPKAFKIKTQSGVEMLAMRLGKGKKSQLRFLYTLKPSANIPARLHFYDTVKSYVDRRGLYHISKGIDYALRTAR